MDTKKIAVIGAGEMGHEITEVFALSGFTVGLIDINKDALTAAVEKISDSLARLSTKNVITAQQAKDALNKIKTYTDMSAGIDGVGFVIEAVPEKLDLKARIFKQLGELTGENTILCSNTSNIRITDIAAQTKNPERVIGTHFFNPPVVLKLVEVIKGEKTSDQVFDSVVQLIKSIGKTPIKVNKDTPGFIVNRISAPEILLFGLFVDKGIAKPEEIDAFVRAQGLPMGPYELFDFVGIDIVNDSLLYFADKLSPDYSKAKVYAELVKDNRLGKKNGAGFYDWKNGRPKILDSARPSDKLELVDIFALEINEAVKLIENGVASPDDIETAVKLGLNRPFGPISVAKGLDNSDVKVRLENLAKKFDVNVFEPAASIKANKMRDAVDGRLSVTDAGQYTAGTKSEFKTILVEKVAPKVMRITLNRPKLNLINGDTLDELNRAMTVLRADTETRVILIRGAGGILSAGADLSMFFQNELQFIEFSKKGQETMEKFSGTPKITIAVIEGYALGGGFELALACDIRLATSGALLGLPEINRGLIPLWGGSQRISKLVGTSIASRLILTGEKMSGKEAFEKGLVSKVIDSDIDAAALEYAKEISENSAPVSAMLAKVLINKGIETPLEAGFDLESTAGGIIFGTDDLKEGLSSFLSKRKPEFKGK
ncbi:3-hydroxyacyl-CoA dehydrogenase/enoyl-CoA hydratase family protein [Candidatus Parvarchaeota archaeon]|jgi:enoyl-CoA hydratase/3-hydroxyacyl-CoA dehydrogenase|nr:3-hydroxyacyl-CoA dehydrogenase/enoyl-CoA hydratase family protein [Candidatus Parvarchaeota archaeon]